MSDCSDIGGHASAPVPWVGLYIAVASLACCLVMAADLLSGVRQRKLHFPSIYFSLNSATLALLGIATKLPADLTTSMPGRHDQLSKLSGTALLCTAIANFMPSLVDMSASEAIVNTIAVVILVVTVVSDVCIQMGTRVIFKFLPENAMLLLLLLLLLIILCSAALSASPTKELLRRYYDHNYVTNKYRVGSGIFDSLKILWVTAQFFSPSYVFGYSEACTAAGALSLAVAGILAEAVIRTATFCSGSSDYRWSTTAVLFAQVVTVGVGTIAPASRLLTAVRFFPDSLTQQCRQTLLPRNKIWTQRLRGWQEYYSPPLAVEPDQNGRTGIWKSTVKTGQQLTSFIIQALIVLNFMIMHACNCVRLCSIRVGRSWERVMRVRNPSISIDSGGGGAADFTISSFGAITILNENSLSLLQMKDLNGWIDKGNRRQPTHLMNLIKNHSTAGDGLRTVSRFDNGGDVLPDMLLPTSWALPIVTLATIVVSLPGLQKESVESLLDAVRQGLKYVKAVDEYHPTSDRGQSNHSIRKATEWAWTELDLHKRWLKLDLHSFQLQQDNGRSALENLKTTALGNLIRTINETTNGRTSSEGEEELFQKGLANTYMYRVTNTILADWARAVSDEELFALLRTMISDNMSACLTNLPSVVYEKCAAGAINERERNVREAALLLGEVQDVLKFLEAEAFARLYPRRREIIDEWCNRRL